MPLLMGARQSLPSMVKDRKWCLQYERVLSEKQTINQAHIHNVHRLILTFVVGCPIIVQLGRNGQTQPVDGHHVPVFGISQVGMKCAAVYRAVLEDARGQRGRGRHVIARFAERRVVVGGVFVFMMLVLDLGDPLSSQVPRERKK